jgi:protein-S-isoprenylcysteine O-methyltransferase Ste14
MPSDEQDKAGVVFHYTRNPAYLSMTMVYTGIASLANALWAIVLLPVALLVIQRGVIVREERYLERKFGESLWLVVKGDLAE